MKRGWPKKTLGEICGFVRGPFGGSLKKAVFVADGFAVYEQQHAIYDQFEDIRYFIDDAKFKEMQRFELRPNDLIMSCSGTMGRVAIVPDNIRRGIINQALLKLTPLKAVSSQFLKYWMDSSDFQDSLKEQSGGAAIQNVASVGILKEIQITLPPLPEQQRIVGLLDEAFEGIATAKANAEKNLQNARALFESQHNSIFTKRREGWGEKPLGEVCKYVNGKAHEQCIDKDGRFIVINSKFISTEGEILKRSNDALLLLKPGDIAMVLSDVPNGKALAKCFLVEEANTYTLNQRICLLRSTKFHTKFLFYQINRNRHFLSFDNGENQTNLRLNQVLSCPLFLPPLAEQETIADNLDALSEETQRLAHRYERKLAALEALKKSLLHQAFTGDL